MNQIKLDKMRKLELKDIAAYLPYRLKVITGHGYHETLYWASDEFVQLKSWTIVYDLIKIKPVLHPMSDLTREITVEGYNEGKPFVPSKVMNLRWYGGEFGIVEDVADEGEYPKIAIMPTDYIDYIDSFNQWHFDYRGLIEQGLAIDINTLNK